MLRKTLGNAIDRESCKRLKNVTWEKVETENSISTE